jgi:Na+/citrate or Na+/malate symporter
MSALGLDALALILIPSYCVHANWIGPGTVESVRMAVDASHAIAAFICILIVGSILGIDARPLARTFPRVVAVILFASIAALCGGVVGGLLAGLDASSTLFLVVVPILGGGLNAGALPLALGYGDAFGDADGVLAVLLPPVLIGNLTAIILAGALGYAGQWRKRRGRPEGMRLMKKAGDQIAEPPALGSVALAILLLLCFAIIADWVERLTGLSPPVFLIGLAGALLLTDALPTRIRKAVVAVYRFSAKVFVYPVLVVVGVLFSPWDILFAGFSLDNVVIVSATVAALAAAGYLASAWIGLDPVEGAIIAVSRAAMGGTGDIAMLSAARRLDLMPFAQVVTRLGGAVTVFLALLAL